MGPEEMTVDVAREIRAELTKIIDRLNEMEGGSRERSLSITKLQEGRMWMGMEMGNVGGEDLNANRDKEIMEKIDEDRIQGSEKENARMEEIERNGM